MRTFYSIFFGNVECPLATALCHGPYRQGLKEHVEAFAVARNIPIKSVGCGATALVALALAIAPYRRFSDNTLSELSLPRNAGNQEQYGFESDNSLLPFWLP
jgi:hypothetical protein